LGVEEEKPMAKKKSFFDGETDLTEYIADDMEESESSKESMYPNKGLGPPRKKIELPEESSYSNKGLGPSRKKIDVPEEVSNVPLAERLGYNPPKVSPTTMKSKLEDQDESDSGTAQAREVKTSTTMKPIPEPEPKQETSPKPEAPVAEDKPTSVKKTKGGEYPVYKRDSESANDFARAFAAARMQARKEGKKVGTFQWQGRSYTTALK